MCRETVRSWRSSKKFCEHEFGEVIKDQYSQYGHLQLIVKQAQKVGMTCGICLSVKPTPTTTATLYAWGWITREKSWLEGLAALTVTEWTNDDRLLNDLGGGHSTRMGKRWMEDMGMQWRDMPNFDVHRQADRTWRHVSPVSRRIYATGRKRKGRTRRRERVSRCFSRSTARAWRGRWRRCR